MRAASATRLNPVEGTSRSQRLPAASSHTPAFQRISLLSWCGSPGSIWVACCRNARLSRTAATVVGKYAYDRLARIKNFYDSENIFRHCQNIKPAS